MDKLNEQELFEKLKKAQIKIQSRNPFFSYLSLFLTFEKDNPKCSKISENGGLGVSSDGRIVFKEEFVETCTDEQLIGVLCHEILHLAFLHILRLKNRQRERWNCATDIAVNSILIKNNFELPRGLVPDRYSDEIKIAGIVIKDVSTKVAEKIYEELPEMQEDFIYVIGGGEGKGKYKYKDGFDTHNTQEGKSKTQAEREKEENAWLNRLDEAVEYARQRGKMPIGMDRWIDKLHKSKLPWRVLLQRYVTQEIPSDYSWAKCSKKGIASGCWLPNTLKEKIDVVAVVDTSGSIGKKELADFLSEIVAIAKSQQNAIDMRFLTHDAEIQDDMEVKNGNVAKILATKLKGGGGTDFGVVVDYIKEKHIKPKVMVWLTDGYGTEIKKQNYPIIWCLTGKNASEDCIKNTGVILRLEND